MAGPTCQGIEISHPVLVACYQQRWEWLSYNKKDGWTIGRNNSRYVIEQPVAEAILVAVTQQIVRAYHPQAFCVPMQIEEWIVQDRHNVPLYDETSPTPFIAWQFTATKVAREACNTGRLLRPVSKELLSKRPQGIRIDVDRLPQSPIS